MIARLIDHMHWSNAAAIAWILENPDAPEECPRLMSHILNAERIWAARARQAPYDTAVFKVHAREALTSLNDGNSAGFRGLLDLDLDLRKPMDYTLLNGSPGRSSIEEMILHVFSHGFHHVGQMAALASKAGKKFPDLSFIGFTRSK